MKTIVTFKALVETRARDEDGVKITVKKGKTFKTTEDTAKIYRGYGRLFEEVAVEYAEPKKDKNTPKNSDAFPGTITENTTNAQIEDMLVEIGAKFKKKGSRAELLKAYDDRLAEMQEENSKDKEEKATEKFKAMIDSRTFDQLEDLADNLDNAVDVEGINKEVCREYILDAYEKAVDKKVSSNDDGEEDEDGNSEGTLDGADAGEGSDATNNLSNEDAKK